MSAPIPAPVARAIRNTRRRLLLDTLLQRVAVASAVGLTLGLGWFLAEPWLVEAPPAWQRWAVLGGLVGIATMFAIIRTLRSAPTTDHAALELDTRFGLRERVTTAVALRPEDHDSPAAAAVLADAEAKVSALALRSQFPIRLRKSAAFVPVLAAGIAAVAIFYHPDTSIADPGTDPNDPANQKLVAALTPEQKKAAPFTKQPAGTKARDNKSEALKELEKELDKTMDKFARDQRDDSPEKNREKVTELTQLEEKLKKFEQEKFEKLARMEQQFKELDKLSKDEDFSDGPAKEFNDALAKGDLKKAKEEVDELRKKAKKEKLDPKDLKKLEKQLDEMANELQRLARNKEREQKLQEMINEAKKEGRDAESLERELEKLREDTKDSSEAMQQLAEQLQRAQQAAANGDLEDLADQLEQASKQLQDVEGELQDLEDVGEYLQRLKEERQAACKKCQGDGTGKGDGEGDSDQPNNGGIGKGRRPENPDAKTAAEDERIRGLFDPRGKKAFGGSVRGEAFTKRTTADFGEAIREAIQEAPQAADAQRLPRDAVDTVKEYFQNLGGQAPNGK